MKNSKFGLRQKKNFLEKYVRKRGEVLIDDKMCSKSSLQNDLPILTVDSNKLFNVLFLRFDHDN